MSGGCYLDTSVLAKWYVAEAGSDAVEKFINGCPVRLLSRLSFVELRCLLARRRRAGDLDTAYEMAAFALFERHIAGGIFTVVPMAEDCFRQAVGLIERLAPLPLRSLDALHLAAALAVGQVDALATADRVMAEAAAALGLEAVRFDSV